MKKLSIRSTAVLSLLGLIAVCLILGIEFSKKESQQALFEEKKTAALQAKKCMDLLRSQRFEHEIAIDNINDPNETGMIGTRFSEITTGRGSLPAKLSTTNPNIAAMVVELLYQTGLKRGDHIAIGATGSFPALNIAALCAAEALELKISLICSTTASSWGANDPEFTYLDMQQLLLENQLLRTPILAASIGGNDDIGRALSPMGRELIENAISRNKLLMINNESLRASIADRMDIFDKEAEQKGEIKAYLNIGGGIASLGSTTNSTKLPSGLVSNPKLKDFPTKEGVVFQMAGQNIDLINLKDVGSLLRKYELPIDPSPMPAVGSGSLYTGLHYNLLFVYIAAALLIAMISGLIIHDRRQNQLGKEIVHQLN